MPLRIGSSQAQIFFRMEQLGYNFCRLANFSISFFIPWRWNITVILASSPSPSRIRTEPSPYLLWRTRSPFFSPVAPVDAGMSIAGRASEPGFTGPALPPKNRAMLSIDPGSGPSGPSLFGRALWAVEDPGLAVIHEATNG